MEADHYCLWSSRRRPLLSVVVVIKHTLSRVVPKLKMFSTIWLIVLVIISYLSPVRNSTSVGDILTNLITDNNNSSSGHVVYSRNQTTFLALDLIVLHEFGAPVVHYNDDLRPSVGRYTRYSQSPLFLIEINAITSIKFLIFPCETCFYVLVMPSNIVSVLQESPVVRKLRFKILLNVQRAEATGKIFAESTRSENVFEEIDATGNRNHLFSTQRFQFRNRHLRLAVYNSDPFIVYDKYRNDSLGVHFELFRTTAVLYNCTYDVLPFSRKYFKHPDGTWGGIIGAIEHDSVDYIFASVAATSDRLKYVDYATYGFFYELTFVTGHPSITISRDAFTKPFTGAVWAYLLTLVTGCVVSLTLFTRFYGMKYPISVALHKVTSLLLAQSMSVPRLLCPPMSFWIFGFLLLSNYYSSKLLSSITSPTRQSFPHTFEDLAERLDFHIEMIHIPGITAHKFVNTTNLDAFVNIRERYELTYDYVGCVVRAATEQRTACIGGTDRLFPLIHKHLMLHRELKPLFMAEIAAKFTFLHSVLPKKSKYMDAVNCITGWARDSGLVQKWFIDVLSYYETTGHQWLEGEGKNISQKLQRVAEELTASPVKVFSLKHLFMIFGVLIAGLMVSFTVFLAELIINHAAKRTCARPVTTEAAFEFWTANNLILEVQAAWVRRGEEPIFVRVQPEADLIDSGDDGIENLPARLKSYKKANDLCLHEIDKYERRISLNSVKSSDLDFNAAHGSAAPLE